MVTQPQFCEKCGAQLEQDANFCESCGSRIAVPVQPAEVPKAVSTVKPPDKSPSKKSRIWQIVSLALVATLSMVALSFFHQTEPPLSNPTSLQSKDLPAAKSYTISGKIFNDINGDGSMGSSDPGLSGWTVNLNRPDGTSTTATTGYDGSYKFENLPQGTYMVSELQQSGWSPTTYATWKVTLSSYDVGDVSIGNKVESANKVQSPVTTTPPALTYSISGRVFNDVNGDGVRSSDDPGLSGWTVRLSGPDGTGKTETTLSDGSYIFKDLSPGTYTISEVLESGWSATSPTSRSATISSADEISINFWNTVPAKKAQSPAMTTPPALTYSISGKVFNDVNGDGVRSSEDPGLSGWTVRLTLPDGTTCTATTDYDGSYKFVNVPPGTYKVSEDLQSGWSATTPATRSVTVSNSDEKGNSFWNNAPLVNHEPGEVSRDTYQVQPTKRQQNIEMEGNRPPTVTLSVTLNYSPGSPTESTEVILTALAEDPDGDRLTYSWFIGGTEIGYEKGSEIRRNLVAGDYEYTVRVSDGKGGTAQDTVRFTVK